MVAAETFQAALLSSDGAHTLRSLVGSLARQWISDSKVSVDVAVVFCALQDVFSHAISDVAREWNSGHDRLRALPPEVQEQCFASLPVSDRCRLALVCSHWCTNVAKLPGIWTRLELKNWRPEVDALLSRSGQLRLDLSVEASGDPMAWDGSLRSHAARLRKLELRQVINDISAALAFPASRLEELSIVTGPDRQLNISSFLFDQQAPRLRTLHLTGLLVPLKCPAFGSVTTLTLRRTRGPLKHLFELMPHLEVLHLLDIASASDLPELPRRFPLRALRLFNVYVNVEKLVRLRYSELDVLDVTTTSTNTSQFLGAVTRWPELATTLTLRADWNVEIVLRPEGRYLRFTMRSYSHGVFQKLFHQRGAALHQLQRLVLPLSFVARPDAPPLLGRNRAIALPALRTLVVACGPAEDAYPLRESIRGKVEVPLLARIEVLKAAEALRDARLGLVDVADLVALVETMLVCDDRSALEVFVDNASGVSLRGDVDQLRNCVGRLLV